MTAGVCIFLTAIVWAVFGATLHDGFINYDDDDYVYQNPVVSKGLTWAGIRWAFYGFHSVNWHPLTWISHMLDCQLYGLNAGGHHLTNVLIHMATVITLFLVLRRMTGALWRSAFVAAVFAIHPLRVESVAWVAERKDVLSGLFFMLTIGAYARYARSSAGNPRAAAQSPPTTLDSRRPARVHYSLALFFFVLGLMCKPMLVSLPFVLLLLDYWPLQRIADWRLPTTDFRLNPSTFQPFNAPPLRSLRSFAAKIVSAFRSFLSAFEPLLIEKIPFFVLAVASCVITVFAQKGAIEPTVPLTLWLRVENALASYSIYLGQMFWPSGLAVLYPFPPDGFGISRAVSALALLAAISMVAFVLRRRPYFLAGWLWYLVMLVPVIGIVQVGLQTHADRYTYLPQIGLYVLLTWTAADLCAGWRHRRAALGGASVAVLAALILCARNQAAYWRNSETLWTHTLACTADNPDARYDLGWALRDKGDVDGAIVQFQRALQMDLDYAEAYHNLGDALLRKGAVDDANSQYQRAQQIKAGVAVGHYTLANALFQKGDPDGAILQYQQALQIKPDHAKAHDNLGFVLFQKGRVAEAIAHYQQALQIKPDFADAQNNLAWALATSPQAALRNGPKALDLARQVNQFGDGKNPLFLATLGAAYAANGRFDEAVTSVQKARDIALASGQTDLAANCGQMLELFKSGRAIGENAATAP